jgi:NAD(P) transhydrogenase subunit alpha
MRIGVPKETTAGERRVALVPEVVGKLVSAGFEVLVQRRRGRGGLVPGCGVRGSGCAARGRLADAEAVVKVQKPSEEEAGRLREGQVLIGFLQPLTDPAGIERSHSAA